MSDTDRAEVINNKPTDLWVDLHLYPARDGNYRIKLNSGDWINCIGTSGQWCSFPQLGPSLLQDGDTRKLGLVLLSGQQAAKDLRFLGKFKLSHGNRIIGEATVITVPAAPTR